MHQITLTQDPRIPIIRAMGFLASLVRGGASLLGRAGGFIGRLFTGGTARAAATVAAGSAAGVGLAGLFGGDGAAGDEAGARGRRTRTIVQTLDEDGQIVRQKVLKGSPFLMRRDLIIAKRVLRTASKLGRFGPKTRTPSKMKQFTDAVIDQALHKQFALPCPT